MMVVRLCLERGCPNHATARGRCDKHRRAKERDRSRARREDGRERNRFYARKRWRVTARRKLIETPICEHCAHELATEVHHHPSLAVLLASGRDPYAFEFLIALCHRCHSRETWLEQRQGVGEGSR